MSMFDNIAATAAEKQESRPGDEVVATANVVMDRGFTVPGSPEIVWPWMVQLGKWRGGWYLPTSVERFLPPRRRAAWQVRSRWQQLHTGDVVPDYGGRHETFTVTEIDPPRALVYRSRRGHIDLTWSILLRADHPSSDNPPVDERDQQTRVLLRLRLANVRRPWLANSAGELLDMLTVAAMAAGLRERLNQPREVPQAG